MLTMPDSLDNQIISLIDSIYLNHKDIILVNSLKKDQEITFNIDLENTNCYVPALAPQADVLLY